MGTPDRWSIIIDRLKSHDNAESLASQFADAFNSKDPSVEAKRDNGPEQPLKELEDTIRAHIEPTRYESDKEYFDHFFACLCAALKGEPMPKTEDTQALENHAADLGAQSPPYGRGTPEPQPAVSTEEWKAEQRWEFAGVNLRAGTYNEEDLAFARAYAKEKGFADGYVDEMKAEGDKRKRGEEVVRPTGIPEIDVSFWAGRVEAMKKEIKAKQEENDLLRAYVGKHALKRVKKVLDELPPSLALQVATEAASYAGGSTNPVLTELAPNGVFGVLADLAGDGEPREDVA